MLRHMCIYVYDMCLWHVLSRRHQSKPQKNRFILGKSLVTGEMVYENQLPVLGFLALNINAWGWIASLKGKSSHRGVDEHI